MRVLIKGLYRIHSKGRQSKRKKLFLRFANLKSLVLKQMENSLLSPTNKFML